MNELLLFFWCLNTVMLEYSKPKFEEVPFHYQMLQNVSGETMSAISSAIAAAGFFL
jgi:hypothetical protein